MTGRKLRPDEKKLWDEVAKTTDKLSLSERIIPVDEAPKSKKIKKPKPTKPTVSQTKPKNSSTSLQMDHKKFQNLKRGKLAPEARIDLHGMTMDQAHPALQRFIKSAFVDGKRLVLIITGKGKSKPDFGPIPEPVGVLRQAVPKWLRQAPLSGMILQIETAHIKHGGAGAYYVYLRRARQ